MWFELRWGITTCLILTVSLILLIFYNHPQTREVTLLFRTVPIVPETNGRVAEVYAGMSGPITEGAPIFRLDDSKQKAAVETAQRKIEQVQAELDLAKTDIDKAEGQLLQAQSAREQTLDELETKQDLQKRNPGGVAQRDIERLQARLDGDLGAIKAAQAARQNAEERVNSVLPAQRATAEAELEQAKVELLKTVIRAGVTGRIEQFVLRVGDVVNPLMRPAGVLIPEGAGHQALQAGFDQIEANVIKVGMTAEVTCASTPWKIIPMVVTQVQKFIAAGQFRAGQELIDVQKVTQPGTLLVFLEPRYKGGIDGVTPGSACIANAYSSHHEEIASKDTGFIQRLAYHTTDGVGLVHALILRLQALMLPFKTLVFKEH